MTLTTALLCLTANVFFEARGEPLAGQHAVAQVTMNRAGRDPKKVCKVVAQPNQFGWTTGLPRVNGAVQVRFDGNFDEKAWVFASQIAQVTLNGWIADFTGGATYFHAKTVRPTWNHRMILTASYGQHRFYRYS